MINQAILLMGPTATGKTELSIRLSQIYPIEIISVDSTLVYQDMNIGSAKPSSEYLKTTPHHLIDIISPYASYSVAKFLEDCINLIYQINACGKIPLLVGGNMMYFNSLLNGISKLPAANDNIRTKIEQQALQHGWQFLYQQLLNIDPAAAAKINSSDKNRIARALEVFYLTGEKMSVMQIKNKLPPPNIKFLPLAILPTTRNELHQRINLRFEKMLNDGLIDEVIFFTAQISRIDN
jgi:tRNA dimethylallyltransferase